MTIAVAKTTTTAWPTTSTAPGPVSVVPGNTKGNLLVLMAAWEQSPTAKGVNLPAGSVADSAGNWWRYVGDSGYSINQPASTVWGCRVGMWVCSNALAIPSWLSFCPQGYVEGLAYAVVEFSGLPASYWPVIDFHIANAKTTNVANDTLTVSATARQADYYLAIGGTNGRGTTPTISLGWTSVATPGVHVPGDTGQGIFTQMAYQVGAGAGAVSATWTYSNTAAPTGLAALIVGISQQSYLPVQSNAIFPRVFVEAALGATPGDPSQAILDDEWTDMSPYALGKMGEVAISAGRGQQYELAQPEVGRMTVAMNNQNGDFNPTNTGADFYSNAINSNMSFQQGIAPWTGGHGASLAQSSAFSFASIISAMARYSLQVTPDGVTAAPQAVSEQVPVNPNLGYSASAWFYSAGGWATGAQTIVSWFDSSHVFISTSSSSAVAVPAGTWTEAVLAMTSPPTNAAFAAIGVQFAGTPAATPFYVAEAILSAGASTKTGTLRLGVPIRTSGQWNGQRFPVGYGNVERWPQEWPDFPQWGWSNLIATDNIGVASIATLPSALQGEILCDVPYLCFPFSEQYSTSVSSLNGVVKSASTADGLPAANTSRANPRTATYNDATIAQVATGQSLALLGDSGTGMGTSGLNAIDTTSHRRGPGVQYGPDNGMPTIKTNWDSSVPYASSEQWIQMPAISSAPASDVYFPLFALLTRPNIKSAGTSLLGAGVFLIGGMKIPSGTTTYVSWLQSSISAATSSPVQLLPGVTYLFQLVFSGGSASLSVNSAGANLISVSIPDGQTLHALTWGLVPYSTGPGQTALSNYTMAYGALYPYDLPASSFRRRSTAGANGFQGDQVLTRIFRYMAWAALNLGLAGPSESYTSLGPAYSTSGSTLSSAIGNDVSSTGARWGAIANGNVVILDRVSQYDRAPGITFGDSPQGVLNPNPGFEYGTSGWVGGGGSTLSVVSSPTFYGPSALLITPDGVTASPRAYLDNGIKIPTTASSQYIVSAWLQSPQGWTSGATLNVDWYSGVTLLSTSTSQVAQLLAGAWTPVVLQATAPATADGAVWYIQMTGTPPASTTLVADLVALRPFPDQVPYLPQMAVDYDNTYLVNAGRATLVQGPNSLATPVYRDPASVGYYFQRGPAEQQVSGTDFEAATDQVTWNLNKYKAPSLRVRQVVVLPSARPLAFDAVLQTDIGDPALALRSPVGGMPYNMPVIVQRVQHDIGPGRWQVSYQQSPYTVDGAILQTDTAKYSVLGNNALAW